MITGLSHITLSVRDLDESFAFYVDVLGFRPRLRWKAGAYLTAGSLWLALDLARQLRRASMSVLLNEAEGSGARGGTRRARYDDALGSARETRAGLEGAEAAGYIETFRSDSRRRLDAIIGTFVRIQHPR